MTVKVNKNFYKELDKKLENGLMSVGFFLQKEIKSKLNRSGEGTSNPGESPIKKSGDLQNSIQIKKVNKNKIEIGSDKIYAPILEAGTLKTAARPYLRPGYRENKKGIIKEFNKGSK